MSREVIDRNHINQFWSEFKEHALLTKRGLGVVHKVDEKFILTQIGGALAQVVNPFLKLYLSARMIDELLGGQNKKLLVIYATLLLGSSFVLSLISSSATHYRDCRNRIIWRGQALELNEKVLNMDYEYIEASDIQDKRRKLQDISNVNNGGGIIRLFYSIFEFFVNLFGVLFAGVFMVSAISEGFFLAEPSQRKVLIGMFIVMSILLIIIAALICRNTAKSNRRQYDITKNFYGMNRVGWFYMNEYLFDYHTGKDIRMFEQYPILKKEFDDYVTHVNRMNDQFANNESRTNGRNAGLIALIGSMIYLYFSCQAWFGLLSVGSIVMYAGAAISFVQYLSEILSLSATLYLNVNYLRPYFEFIDLTNSKSSGKKETTKAPTDHIIEFKNVSFKYPNTNEYVLQNLSMKIEPNKRTAIVGKNGSGKTTLIKLLCRLYDPTEGEILCDGVNIKEYAYEAYLNLFSVVFQDFSLLSSSVAKNIAASETFDEEKVRVCLDKIGMLDQVEKMGKGIHTVLYQYYDKSGREISGGEAQKIAIARALYKDAPFVIMDEPTAALDPVSEHEIYYNFDALVENKTAIYISHRLSSCRFCDDIIVLDKGDIVQRGAHEELVKKEEELYFKLWNAQAQYYA